MLLLDYNYRYNKPIELNETAYYPFFYKGDAIGASRVESWEFIVGGGASFNQLNSLYSTPNPAAEGTGIDVVLNSLKNLKDFMYSFDFIKMQRDTSFVIGGVPEQAFARGISEPGKQYAFYMHHSKLVGDNYVVQPGIYQENLTLNIPAGNYKIDWIDPVTGNVVSTENISYSGERCVLATPEYKIDIALRITLN
jgi:hypothetical protein